MSDSPASSLFEKLAEQGRKTAEQSLAASQEFMKKFTSMNAGALPDTQALIAAHQRNLEAISAANKVALEGAQAVAKRNMEIMQQTSADMADTIKALSSGEDTQSKAARQTELIKQAYETAIANMRELRDLVANSTTEAVEMLNRRFLESLDEIKAIVEKSK